MRKLKIELFLVAESVSKTDSEILKEIIEAFDNEEISIPWVKKMESISLIKNNQTNPLIGF